MKISFWGAAETVTGSKYCIEHEGSRILVDCGLFQGLRELRARNWEALPIKAEEIEAVVVTHAHLDHSGYIPLLVKQGFRGRIYCTSGTRDLCDIILRDSGKIHEEDAEYANRKGFSQHKPALPLYTEEDAVNSLKQFQTVDYNAQFEITKKLKVRLTQAGHILGASCATVSSDTRSVVFSGDLGRSNDLLHLPPTPLKKADDVVFESTYGDRIHESANVLDQLEDVINRTAHRQGVVMIPAFSVGRCQILLYSLYLLKHANRIPDIPVYLNSPMSVDATDIFCRHVGEHRLNVDQCRALHKIATFVRSVEESKALNEKKGPMIIVAASGMMDGGRILHHLRTFGPDAKNALLITGYQAAGTRGARLMAGEKELKIHGQMVPINAEIVVIHNLSAHADQNEMVKWLSNFDPKPKMAFITHGETGSSSTMKQVVEKSLGWNCTIPKPFESFDL